MPPPLGGALLMPCSENRLEAFLRRAGKSSYYTNDSLPTVAALCEQADEQLFRSIKYKPTHPLRPLLPPERSTPYCTRPRPHNYKLPSKINNIDECNFIYRVLYKDCLVVFSMSVCFALCLQRFVCYLF